METRRATRLREAKAAKFATDGVARSHSSDHDSNSDDKNSRRPQLPARRAKDHKSHCRFSRWEYDFGQGTPRRSFNGPLEFFEDVPEEDDQDDMESFRIRMVRGVDGQRQVSAWMTWNEAIEFEEALNLSSDGGDVEESEDDDSESDSEAESEEEDEGESNQRMTDERIKRLFPILRGRLGI